MSTDVVPQARELTAEEREQRALECSLLDNRIKSALAAGREALWDLAQALYEFREASAWTALGYESLGEYLADPDVTLTWPTFDRLVQGWRELVINRAVDSSTLRNLHPTKVQIALPALTSGRATLEEVVSDVQVLGARDMREKYTQRGEPPVVSDDDVIEGDGEDLDDEGFQPIVVDDDDDEDAVPRGVAQTLTLVLENVLAVYGNPARKTVSATMRVQIEDALALAHEYGLGGPGG